MNLTPGYKPPLRDIRFALEQIADLPGLSKLESFAHVDTDTAEMLLKECGRFASDALAPLNRHGDLVGSTFDPESGVVTTPEGWQQAYLQFVKGGWGSAHLPVEHGGGGFPWLVGVAIQEIVTSANMAFSLCPMLTQGAIHLLDRHGSPEQRSRYLPKMVSGEWTGTMDLTESHAGSDVGALSTRAVPALDGSWSLTGQKIFITYGDHDLADNIIHLVLARVPGSPPGTKGISCFIVPKYLPGPDGQLGRSNSFRCSGIEHKLGIHASPTCVMDFEGATGYLIGDPNAGMSYMFTMMNAARLAVGLEGLAVAEAAYQKAYLHAAQRVQGRPIAAKEEVGTTIIEHPDIRRSLLTMRSLIEAMRGLAYVNAQAVDLAAHAETESEREAGQELCDIVTPVMKAWCTDVGAQVVNMAVQVHGGMGYIEETGIAQHYRDIRIASIYEGTNGIQAVDLVTRKLGIRGGQAVCDLIDRVGRTQYELWAAGPSLELMHRSLAGALGAVRKSTSWLLSRGSDQRSAILAGASPYLQQWGLVLGAWVLARQALVAEPGAKRDPYLAAKLSSARFYFDQILPAAQALTTPVTAGSCGLYSVTAEQLASR